MVKYKFFLILLVISLICPNVCSLEIQGGINAYAQNADISGISYSDTFVVDTGGYVSADHIEPGEMIGVYETEAHNNALGYAGAFQFSGVTQVSGVTAANTVIATVPASNDVSSVGYKYWGYKWAALDPKVPLVVDSSNRGTGIIGIDLALAINAAASTWDAASPRQLFGSLQFGAVPLGGSWNSKNEVGWAALGTTRTIALTSVKSPWTALTKYFGEVDVMFNNQLTWTTAAASDPEYNPRNIRYNALHELGHVLGMGELSKDTKEVMAQAWLIDHSFANKYSLGLGDRVGIMTLYP
jgi:hypothetical protein